jgi:ribonucleoside-diphosphate reductase beta chain
MSVFKKSASYKPFRYPFAFEAYDLLQKMHWLPSEVPLQEDVHDWNNKLTLSEKNLLTQLFRFFTKGDEDITHGYLDVYIPMFKPTEIRMMLSAIATQEANHIHSYSQLIDTVGMPESDYSAFAEYAEMAEKHEYMFADRTEGADGRRFTPRERLALDLAVFSAFGEGMQLFSSFAVLLSFKRRNLMKGMSTIVEWSLRDESLHVECMVKLFHTMIKENPKLWNDDVKAAIRQIAKEMVKLEDQFIDLMFDMGEIAGITAEDTKTYIRYTADRRMIQLGLKPIYRQKDNPFEWIDEMMSAHTHTNFFEGRSTEYAKGGVTGWNKDTWNFVAKFEDNA